jgi:hypothetical protein
MMKPASQSPTYSHVSNGWSQYYVKTEVGLAETKSHQCWSRPFELRNWHFWPPYLKRHFNRFRLSEARIDRSQEHPIYQIWAFLDGVYIGYVRVFASEANVHPQGQTSFLWKGWVGGEKRIYICRTVKMFNKKKNESFAFVSARTVWKMLNSAKAPFHLWLFVLCREHHITIRMMWVAPAPHFDLTTFILLRDIYYTRKNP